MMSSADPFLSSRDKMRSCISAIATYAKASVATAARLFCSLAPRRAFGEAASGRDVALVALERDCRPESPLHFPGHGRSEELGIGQLELVRQAGPIAAARELLDQVFLGARRNARCIAGPMARE